NAKHRLGILADVLAIIRQHRVRVAEAERRFPPGDIMIAWHDDDLTVPLCVLEKNTRALKLTRARPLREVPRDRDDVVMPVGDDRLDALILLGHGGMPEVQIRAMKQGRR